MFWQVIRGDPYVLLGFVTKLVIFGKFSGKLWVGATAGDPISQGGLGEDPPLANDIRTIRECSEIHAGC